MHFEKAIIGIYNVHLVTYTPILLELKYPTIPAGMSPIASTASEVFAGLIYAWSNQVYFKVVVFTKGFFDKTEDLVLKIIAWHEKQHVIGAEEHIQKGAKTLTEQKVVQNEVKYVRETYGNAGFEARRNNLLSNEIRLKTADAILGILSLMWIREHIGKNYQKYTNKAYSFPLTQNSKKLHLRFNEVTFKIFSNYETLGKNPSSLFKHSLKDY
ncbi:MAG: hypothetical protein NWF10_00375 [Candidatus Bathyarchaeota archaeon]|nr:hypothetical protein [Candidatus Bathyarchaeota archaeon]